MMGCRSRSVHEASSLAPQPSTLALIRRWAATSPRTPNYPVAVPALSPPASLLPPDIHTTLHFHFHLRQLTNATYTTN